MYNILILVILTTSAYCNNDKYQGDKVVVLTVHQNDTYQKLSKYVSSYPTNKINVWSQHNTKCELQVSNDTMNSLRKFCKKENITMEVAIKDVKTAIDREYREMEKQKSKLKAGKFDYNMYNTYEAITNELFRLQCRYPRLIDIVTEGYSFEGRPLYIVKISENVQYSSQSNFDFKPIIWLDGGIHAREWISVATIMQFIKKLLEGFPKNREIFKLLRFNTFYLVPVFNPDGYVYTFTDDRLWRKTRTDYGLKCIGADANRNWDIMWAGAGTSNDSCSIIFHGIHPESEPCVSVYATALRKIKHLLKAYWAFHSFGQLFLFASTYTTTPPSDIQQIQEVALAYTQAVSKSTGNRYFALSGANLFGPLTGIALDYVHDKLNLTHSYSVELRPLLGSNSAGFLLDASEIEPTSNETFDAVLASIKVIDKMRKAERDKQKFNAYKLQSVLRYLLEVVSSQIYVDED